MLPDYEQCVGCGGARWITLDLGRIACPNCNPRAILETGPMPPSFVTLADIGRPTTMAASLDGAGLHFTLGTGVAFSLTPAEARALADWILAQGEPGNTATSTPEGT